VAGEGAGGVSAIQGLLQSWGAARIPVNSDGKLDVVQYLALVKLCLREQFRSAATSERRKSNPLVSTVISMTMFGYLFYSSRRYSTDLSTYLILLFTTALCIVVVGIIPDSSAVYQRNIEVLHSKPVNERTHLAAATTIRLLLILLMLTPYSAIPLISARFTFDASWGRLAGSYIALIAAAFSVMVIWFSILVSSARWISAEKYRTVARYALIGIFLLLFIPVLAPYLDEGRKAPLSLSLSSLRAVQALPSAWFANLFAPDFHLISNLQRVGALVIVCAAVWLSFTRKSSMYYAHVLERMIAVDERPTRRPLVVKLISTIRQIPLAGKRLIPDQAFSIASLILLSTGREDASRLRTLPSRAVVLCIFCLYIFKPNPVLLLMMSFYGFSGIGEGVHLISRSSFPGACWPLIAGPIEPEQLRKGIHLAVLSGYFAVPAALCVVAVYVEHNAGLATALAISYFIQAKVLISLYLILSPRIPLSETATPGGGFGGAFIGLTYNLLNVITYAILLASIEYLGQPGFIVAGIILLMMAGGCYLANTWASLRLARVELAL
jgi:hypothetical protein